MVSTTVEIPPPPSGPGCTSDSNKRAGPATRAGDCRGVGAPCLHAGRGRRGRVRLLPAPAWLRPGRCSDSVGAALWPPSVDGLLVLATVGVLTSSQQASRRYRIAVWVSLCAGIAISLTANISAAPTLTCSRACGPPVALLLAVELLAHSPRSRQHTETDQATLEAEPAAADTVEARSNYGRTVLRQWRDQGRILPADADRRTREVWHDRPDPRHPAWPGRQPLTRDRRWRGSLCPMPTVRPPTSPLAASRPSAMSTATRTTTSTVLRILGAGCGWCRNLLRFSAWYGPVPDRVHAEISHERGHSCRQTPSKRSPCHSPSRM